MVPKQNENSTWIYKTKLLDSKESIEDIKFAPKHLGLMLATGSAEGIFRIYEVPDILNLAFWRIIVEYSVASFPITSISWNKNPFEMPMLAVAVKCFQSRPNDAGSVIGGEGEGGGEGVGRGGKKGRGGEGEGGEGMSKGRGEGMDKRGREGKGGRGKGQGGEIGGGEEEGGRGRGGGREGRGPGGVKLGEGETRIEEARMKGGERKGDLRSRLRGEAGSILGGGIVVDAGLKSGSTGGVLEGGMFEKQGGGEGGAIGKEGVGLRGDDGVFSVRKLGEEERKELGIGSLKEKTGFKIGNKGVEGIVVQTGQLTRTGASIEDKDISPEGMERSSAAIASVYLQVPLTEEPTSATPTPNPDESSLKIFASIDSNWELLKNLCGHEGGVNDVSWAPINGRSYELLVSGGRNEILVWNVKVEGKKINVFKMEKLDYGDHCVVWKVSWNMMATVLASSDERNVVKLWKRGGNRWKCVGILNEEEDEESKEDNLPGIK